MLFLLLEKKCIYPFFLCLFNISISLGGIGVPTLHAENKDKKRPTFFLDPAVICVRMEVLLVDFVFVLCLQVRTVCLF